MSKLKGLISKAEFSSFYKGVLNYSVSRAIPFNAPHHFSIMHIKEGEVSIKLPYKRSNLNHVKGIHACALATLCEFTTGLALISIISEQEYRIILKSLKVDYHYQAKMNVSASFQVTYEYVKSQILIPLEKEESVLQHFIIDVKDDEGNHICTGDAEWQIKNWNKVKSKI